MCRDKNKRLQQFFICITVLGVFCGLLSEFPFQVLAYTTNMNASVVIGQQDMTHVSVGNQGGVAGANTLRNPRQIAIVGNKLIVADGANNRALIYNQIPTINNASADVVVGQPDFVSANVNQGGSVGANTMGAGRGVASDGTKLFIADETNNRVLIFNHIPTTNNASADVVIGQADLTHNSSNQGQVNPSANTLKNPDGVAYDATTGKLIVYDANNNRVLIFNSVPTTNNASADVVVGQADFTHGSANQGGSANNNTLSIGTGVSAVATYNGKLLIADKNNNRVLIFNHIPTTNNAAADLVIGQTNFTNVNINQGGSTPTANTLNQPSAESVDSNGRLFISDRSNNRVLVYNNFPTSNNVAADLVIGQPDFVSNANNQGGTGGANTLWQGSDVEVSNNQLFVTDLNNSRLLIFNNVTPTPGVTFANPSAGSNGLTRLSGTATTGSLYTISSVQYSINGGSWQGATPTDGAFNSALENFSFDFDPTSNGNTNPGYVAEAYAQDSNLDNFSNSIFFQPFALNSPANNSSTTQQLPTFTFSVNTQESLLKQDLDHYRILIAKDGGGWQTYLDNIPVDYASVQNNSENLQATTLNTNGNGNYDTTTMWVNYSNNNSIIAVRAKTPNEADLQPVSQNGKMLTTGIYTWKVEAVDKRGHTQDTDIWTLLFATSLPSNTYFPIQLSSISGVSHVFLSSLQPSLNPPEYTTISDHPTFFGIAPVSSMVSLTITNQNCVGSTILCTHTFTTTANANSEFGINLPNKFLILNSPYLVRISATQQDNSVELPTFILTLQEAGLNQKSSNIVTTPPENASVSAVLNTALPLSKETASSSSEHSQFSSPTVSIGQVLGKMIEGLLAPGNSISKFVPPVFHVLAPLILLGLLPLTSLATVLLNAANTQLSWSIIFRSLQALGILPKGNPQGIVYDSKTNAPIPFALLTFKDQTTNNLIQETVVSDVHGIYSGIKLPPGEYTLDVRHNEYIFPSRHVRPSYLPLKDFYQGQVFAVTKQNESQFFFIPLDTLTPSAQKKQKMSIILKRFFSFIETISKLLFWPLALLSIILFFTQINIWNGLIALVYGVLICWKLVHFFSRPTFGGYIHDQAKTPIFGAIVRLIDPKSNQALEVTRTDREGRYVFFSKKNPYHLSVMKMGYSDPEESVGSFRQIDARKQKKIDIQLSPV